jgi:hypothetical protein
MKHELEFPLMVHHGQGSPSLLPSPSPSLVPSPSPSLVPFPPNIAFHAGKWLYGQSILT